MWRVLEVTGPVFLLATVTVRCGQILIVLSDVTVPIGTSPIRAHPKCPVFRKSIFVNNDLENGRNICANVEESQENYDCDIFTTEAITSNENISKDPNVLSLESKDF